MPVQGICHAFQFVQSLCLFALAQFANCGLLNQGEFTDLGHLKSSVIRQQPEVHDTFASEGFLLLRSKSDPGCTLFAVASMTDGACL